MSSQAPQTVEPEDFIPVDEYQFAGNSATVEIKRKIVEGFRLKASIYHAAQYAGVHRVTVHRYINRDAEFAQAMADSFEDAADVMETSAYEDALGRDGKRGDAILKMFWLKAHRPKFRDRLQLDLDSIKSEIRAHLDRLAQRQLPSTSIDNDEYIDVSMTATIQPDSVTTQQPTNQSSLKQKED